MGGVRSPRGIGKTQEERGIVSPPFLLYNPYKGRLFNLC